MRWGLQGEGAAAPPAGLAYSSTPAIRNSFRITDRSLRDCVWRTDAVELKNISRSARGEMGS